jgi:glycosyltransferase involved in cell wall biosynthesis
MSVSQWVDIVIPSYKPDRFEQALKSAIGQTYPWVNIYVADNCPNEEIQKIVRKYASPNLYYQRSHAYITENFEYCFRLGTARFIKPLFDDDVLHPFCVERMYDSISRGHGEGVRLVFSQSAIVDASNRVTGIRRPFDGDIVLMPKQIMSLALRNIQNFIGEFSSVMFDRDLVAKTQPGRLFYWRDVSGYDGLADIVFFLSVGDSHSVSYIDECLSYFRIDPSITSSTSRGNPVLYTKWFDLIERAISCADIANPLVISRRRVEGLIVDALQRYPSSSMKGRCDRFISQLASKVHFTD